MKDMTKLLDELNAREGISAVVKKDYTGRERIMVKSGESKAQASSLVAQFKDLDMDDDNVVRTTADKLVKAAENGSEVESKLDTIMKGKKTLLEHLVPCLERTERIDMNTQVHHAIKGIEGMELVYRVKFQIPDPFEEPKGHPQTVEGNKDNPIASFILTRNQMEMLNLDEDDLEMAAWFNYSMNYRLEDFRSVLSKMFGYEIPIESDPEWLMLYTDPTGIEGSAGILRPEIMDRAKKMLGSEKLIILPSSKSEVIIMDYDKCPADKSKLSDMVFDINMTQVSEKERLINNALILSDEKGFQMI